MLRSSVEKQERVVLLPVKLVKGQALACDSEHDSTSFSGLARAFRSALMGKCIVFWQTCIDCICIMLRLTLEASWKVIQSDADCVQNPNSHLGLISSQRTILPVIIVAHEPRVMYTQWVFLLDWDLYCMSRPSVCVH